MEPGEEVGQGSRAMREHQGRRVEKLKVGKKMIVLDKIWFFDKIVAYFLTS